MDIDVIAYRKQPDKQKQITSALLIGFHQLTVGGQFKPGLNYLITKVSFTVKWKKNMDLYLVRAQLSGFSNTWSLLFSKNIPN